MLESIKSVKSINLDAFAFRTIGTNKEVIAHREKE
jgi:hypothetical protein